jgi:hypothetical protein
MNKVDRIKNKLVFEKVNQWLNGDLKIPLNVLFDTIIIPCFGKLRIVSEFSDPYYVIYWNCCNALPSIRSKMFMNELFVRGFHTDDSFRYNYCKDSWVSKLHVRYGLPTVRLINRDTMRWDKISKL